MRLGFREAFLLQRYARMGRLQYEYSLTCAVLLVRDQLHNVCVQNLQCTQ